MIKRLELISKPDEVFRGRIYTKENYDEIRNSEFTKKLLKSNELDFVDFDLVSEFDYTNLTADPNTVIGKVIKWEDNHIEVDISEKYEDKYDWDNCKAGFSMLCTDQPTISGEPRKIIIERIMYFHIISEEECKRLLKNNNEKE